MLYSGKWAAAAKKVRLWQLQGKRGTGEYFSLPDDSVTLFWPKFRALT